MIVNQKKLKKIANDACKKIENNSNSLVNDILSPHIVVDNFLDDNIAKSCLESFPNSTDDSWDFANDKDIEIKYRSTWESEFDVPDNIINVVRILNSSIFLQATSKALGIDKLIPDPYFTGGGLNLMKKGGLLDVHVDGNYHDASGLNRRVNAILFLNPIWKKGWGGEFCFFDKNGKECIKKIDPLFNRLLIFDTNDKSFHGLPNPINFPDDHPRRSLILYYYTKDQSPSNIQLSKPHSALWIKRNLKDKKGKKYRQFE